MVSLTAGLYGRGEKINRKAVIYYFKQTHTYQVVY